MKNGLAVLLFAVAAYAAAPAPGRLVVRMSPGFEVIVDGTSYGPTTVEEGGKLLQLAPGAHHVVVRSAEGREGAFDVDLAAGETREVSLSPLGLRKKLAATESMSGALRVVCIPEDCSVTFKPPMDDVVPGRHALVVTRGNSVLKSDVDIPASTIVTVEANFTAGTIRVIDSRPRPRRIAVAEANDALSRLAVPSYWKTAIRGALPSGVVIEAAEAQPNNMVQVTMRVPSVEVGRSMILSVVQSHAFVDIKTVGKPRADKTGWLYDLVFTFPE